MVNKKTLILAATMVPMLGLANVEAMHLDGFHNRMGYALRKHDKVKIHKDNGLIHGQTQAFKDNDLIRKNDDLVNQNNKLRSENVQLENWIIRADEVTEFLYFHNAELDRENAELVKANAELARKNVELIKSNAELDRENANLDMKNTNLEKQIDDLKRQCAYLDQCIAEFNQINAGHVQQCVLSYQQRCEDKENALKRWKDHGKRLESENEQLKSENKQLKHERDDWEQHWKDANQLKYKILPENEHFKKENDRLIKQVNGLTSENATIEEQLNFELKIAHLLSNENARFKDKIGGLRNKINDFKNDFKSARDKQMEENEQLKNKVVRLNGKLSTLRSGFIGFLVEEANIGGQ